MSPGDVWKLLDNFGLAKIASILLVTSGLIILLEFYSRIALEPQHSQIALGIFLLSATTIAVEIILSLKRKVIEYATAKNRHLSLIGNRDAAETMRLYKGLDKYEKEVLRFFIDRHNSNIALQLIAIKNDVALMNAVQRLIERHFLIKDHDRLLLADAHYINVLLMPSLVGSKQVSRQFG